MHYDYIMSQRIDRAGFPFYAIIMAAMRKADDENLQQLQDAFPDV